MYEYGIIPNACILLNDKNNCRTNTTACINSKKYVYVYMCVCTYIEPLYIKLLICAQIIFGTTHPQKNCNRSCLWKELSG